MVKTVSCLCCGDRLLRHVRRSGVCWCCPSCRLEVDERLLTLARPGDSRPNLAAQPQPLTAVEAGEIPSPAAA